MEEKIRLKSDTGRKSSGKTIDPELREELKKEILAELVAELGLGTAEVEEDKPPIIALKNLVTKQNKRFRDMNPVIQGKEYYEVRRGEKLIYVEVKEDGTKIFKYIGRVSKNPKAKQQFELAKKEGKLTYR